MNPGPARATKQNSSLASAGLFVVAGGRGWLKSKRHIQGGRNITAIFVVVHSNQVIYFVQKVLFMAFLNSSTGS